MGKRPFTVATCGLLATLVAAVAVSAQPRSAPPAESGTAQNVPISVEFDTRDLSARPSSGSSIRVRNQSDKAVVSYGLQLLRRDGLARVRPVRGYLVRPSREISPQHAHPIVLGFDGAPPEYELRVTFALFADGTWAGNGDEARHEILSRREGYLAARALGQVIAGAGEAPTRTQITRVVEEGARQLARATSRATRTQLESVLRTLGAVLDERTRAGRSYAEVLNVVRNQIDRMLTEGERLAFVKRSEIRG